MEDLIKQAWHILVVTLLLIAISVIGVAIIEKGTRREPSHKHHSQTRETKTAWIPPRKDLLARTVRDLPP